MTNEEGRNIALEIHRGNRDAVADLVATYEDILFNYAYHMLGGTDDANDITQDAFVRAYTTLTGKYDEERCRTLEIRPWLFRIVRNLAFNRLRARKRRAAAQDRMAVELTVSNSAREPSDDQTLALRLALAGLGGESRELIILRFIEQSSYVEIASITGSSESALRGKVFRALRKLRKIMEDTPHGL